MNQATLDRAHSTELSNVLTTVLARREEVIRVTLPPYSRLEKQRAWVQSLTETLAKEQARLNDMQFMIDNRNAEIDRLDVRVVELREAIKFVAARERIERFQAMAKEYARMQEACKDLPLAQQRLLRGEVLDEAEIDEESIIS